MCPAGIKYLRDCPKEPYLPMYMLVGGILGTVRMAWLVWRQSVSRRYAQLGQGLGQAAMDSDVGGSLGARIACWALSLFLIAWFCMGNYWIVHIMWPAYAQTLYEPNAWCDKTLYVFAVVHLVVCYTVISASVAAAVFLSCYQLIFPVVLRFK